MVAHQEASLGRLHPDCPQTQAPPQLPTPATAFLGLLLLSPGPDFGKEEAEPMLARKPCVHI